MPKYDPFLKKLRKSDIDLYDKGKYANESAINVAYPTGELGWFTFNYDTDTWWVWDGDTSAWVDTDTKGAVDSVNSKTGAVVLDKEDIGLNSVTDDAQLKIASNLSDLNDVDTAVSNLGLNTFQSSFTSADSTGFVWTDNTLVITHSLAKFNLDVSLVDGSGNKLDYTMTETDLNTLTINFPVGSVPITGTWNIKIF